MPHFRDQPFGRREGCYRSGFLRSIKTGERPVCPRVSPVPGLRRGLLPVIVSAVSFPPSQKTRGRGTRNFVRGRKIETAKGSATRLRPSRPRKTIGFSEVTEKRFARPLTA